MTLFNPKSASDLPSTNPSDWLRVSHKKTIQYIYKQDPDIRISRRQYDKYMGVLAKLGLSSYEQAAKIRKIRGEDVISDYGFRSRRYRYTSTNPVKVANAISKLDDIGKRELALFRVKLGDRWLSTKTTFNTEEYLNQYLNELARRYTFNLNEVSEYEYVVLKR